MKKTLDKKGKLILKIFKFGKRHSGKTGIYHKLCFSIYKIENALINIGIFNTEIQPSKTINDDIFLYHPYGIIINPEMSI